MGSVPLPNPLFVNVFHSASPPGASPDAVRLAIGREVLLPKFIAELELEEGLAGSEEGSQLFERDT